MAASSLAIITASFPPGPKLHRAIGTWAAMNGLGGAAGVLLGGVITEVLSWRWVLLINPPIGIAAALVAYGVVSERRRSAATVELRPRRRADADARADGARLRGRGSGPEGLEHRSRALGPIVVGVVLLGGVRRDRGAHRVARRWSPSRS